MDEIYVEKPIEYRRKKEKNKIADELIFLGNSVEITGNWHTTAKQKKQKRTNYGRTDESNVEHLSGDSFPYLGIVQFFADFGIAGITARGRFSLFIFIDFCFVGFQFVK